MWLEDVVTPLGNEKPLYLYDLDNIKNQLTGELFTELLKQHKYRNKTDFLNMLQEQKSLGAELIVGLAGTGKTSYAMQKFGAIPISTEEDIRRLFELDSYDMVFTKCLPVGIVAEQAGHITGLVVSPSRLVGQRQRRNQQIVEGTSETWFGRNPGTTDYLPTDSDEIISVLKTEFPDKSDIVKYTSENPTNFTDMELLNVEKDIDDSWKYSTEGVAVGIGKIVVPHQGHENYFNAIVEVGKEHHLRSVLFVTPSSGDEYNFAVTQGEKKKFFGCLDLPELSVFYGAYTPFLKFGERDFVKVDPAKSIGVLAKDRLPEGFNGSYADLVNNYPAFYASKESEVAKSLTGQSKISHFIAGKTVATDDWAEMSATRVRKALVEKNKAELQQLLSPALYGALATEANFDAVEHRYHLCLEMEKEKTDNKAKQENLKSAFDEKYRYVNPLTGEPLVDAEGKPKKLTRAFASKKLSDEEQKKILNYIDELDEQYEQELKDLKQEAKEVEKKYKAQIYAKENMLQL